ncbi:Transcriptional regulatory protein YycF [compost metagenome]
MLGGSISATSRLGQGSVFTLFLPLYRKGHEVSQEEQSSRLFVYEAVDAKAKERIVPSSPQMDPKRENMDNLLTPLEESLFRDRQILVVDDDIRNVYALANALEQYGMQVTSAQNGTECLEMLEQGGLKPDVILMDIMMPELDGYETTRRIREQLGLTQIPIIVLTAKAMKEDRDKCIAAGATDYLSKPLNIKDVLSRMKLWISHEKMEI